jgi:hypothetical protein
LSTNIVERNASKYKYVEIFTYRHVGSIGAPSRRTMFVRGTSTEQREFPEISGRNTKANIFHQGSARFKATVDRCKKVASRKCVLLSKECTPNLPRQQYRSREHEGETIKTDGRKLRLEALKLIGLCSE